MKIYSAPEAIHSDANRNFYNFKIKLKTLYEVKQMACSLVFIYFDSSQLDIQRLCVWFFKKNVSHVY